MNGSPGAVDADYDTVMAATGWGLIAPGEWLTIPQAAARCGVSEAGFEDAVPRLVKDRILHVRESLVAVTEADAAQLHELLELRVLIEVKLARQAAEADLTSSDAADLTRLTAECHQAAEQGDLLDYIRSDLRFHLRLCAITGDPESVELVRVLRIRNRIGGMESSDRQRFMDLNADDHAQLTTAVIAGDPIRAGELLRRHILRIPDAWLQSTDDVDAPSSTTLDET